MDQLYLDIIEFLQGEIPKPYTKSFISIYETNDEIRIYSKKYPNPYYTATVGFNCVPFSYELFRSLTVQAVYFRYTTNDGRKLSPKITLYQL